MLVLTRKLDQEILIGDDIRVTLVKTRGNTVRIGIEAPREIRVIRGELADAQRAVPEPDDVQTQPSDQEQPFAHPPQGDPSRAQPQGSRAQQRAARRKRDRAGEPAARRSQGLAELVAQRGSQNARAKRTDGDEPQLFVGSVGRRGEAARLRRSPLAGSGKTN